MKAPGDSLRVQRIRLYAERAAHAIEASLKMPRGSDERFRKCEYREVFLAESPSPREEIKAAIEKILGSKSDSGLWIRIEIKMEIPEEEMVGYTVEATIVFP